MLYGERARQANGRRKMRDGVIEGPKHEHALKGQHRRTGKAYGRQARSGRSPHDEVRATKRADPKDIRGGQRESKRVGNGVWEDRTRRKVRALNMVDRVETVVRRTSSSVVDWMEPTVRDHSAEMVDREAAVARVDGVVLLEVEDKTGQAHEDAKDSVGRLGRKSRVLSPYVLAHTGGCAARWGRMS